MSKTEKGKMDGEQCDMSQLKRWYEQVKADFHAEGLYDLFSGKQKCNLDSELPKMSYALKFKEVSVGLATDLSCSPLRLSGSNSGTSTPFASTPLRVTPVVTPTLTTRKACSEDDTSSDVKIDCPDLGDCELTRNLTITTDESLYFRRLDAVKSERHKMKDLYEKHEQKVTKGIGLIRDKCTVKLLESLADEFATRDIPLIIESIQTLCGPGSITLTIDALKTQYLTLTKSASESYQAALVRLEDLAKDLDAHGVHDENTDAARIIAANRLLTLDRHYTAVWFHVIREAQRSSWSWKRFKEEVHNVGNQLGSREDKIQQKKEANANKKSDATLEQKALMANPEVRKMLDIAKKEARDAVQKQIKPKDEEPAKEKPEAKKRLPHDEWVKTQDCRNCHERGHLAKECPKKKEAKDKKEAEAKSNATAVSSVGENEEECVLEWECNPADRGDTSAAAWTTGSEDETEGACIGVRGCVDSNGTGGMRVATTAQAHCTTTGSELPLDGFIGELREQTEKSEPTESPVNSESNLRGGISCVLTVPAGHDNLPPSEQLEPVATVSVDATKKCIIDSGSTNHVIGDLINRMTEFKPRHELISLGNSTKKVESQGRGTLGMCKDALWAPDMSYSLISAGKFDNEGKFSVMGNGMCHVFDTVASAALSEMVKLLQHRVELKAHLQDGLYVIHEDLAETCAASVSKPTSDVKPFTHANNRAEIRGHYGTENPGAKSGFNALEVLHRRFGHASERTLKHALKCNAIIGANTTYDACKDLHIGFCETCQRGQMMTARIPKGVSTFTQLAPFEAIGIDPVPLTTLTRNGNGYINVGICLATKFVFTYESATNGDQKQMLKNIQRDYCVPFGHTIRLLFTDHHSVFLSKEVQNYLLDQLIKYKSSPPYEHARNFVEGAAVKPLLIKARILLIEAQLSPKMCGFAMRFAAQVYNVTPHPRGETTTPYEKVTGVKPDVSILRPFGARVLYHKAKEEIAATRDPRWAEKAGAGILVGYSAIVDGAYLIMTGNGQIITRRQVLVHEEKGELPRDIFEGATKEGDILSDRETENTGEPVVPEPMQTRGALRALQRQSAITQVTNAVCDCDISTTVSAAASEEIPLPPSPRGIKQAEASQEANKWREAIQREVDVMRNPVSPKICDFHGTPERFMRAVLALRVSRLSGSEFKFKARLCPDGSTQVKGIDYAESYSPTARSSLIFMLLHIVGSKNYEARQFDVGAAYLEVPARSQLFMRLTDDMMRVGFGNTRFVELLTNFYGTHDAGRAWFIYFTHLLLEFGFNQSKEEPCLFTLVEGEGDEARVLYVLLFVDDGAYVGNWLEKMTELEKFLASKVNKIMFKELERFVGLTITRDKAKRTVSVNITDYASDLVEKFKASIPSRPADTPLVNTSEYRGLKGDEQPIWGITGKLLFMSQITWPDLLVPASLLSSGGATPHVNHTKGVQRALKYVQTHSVDRDLVLGGDAPIVLMGYSDASYDPAGDSKFQYGYAMALNSKGGCYNVTSQRSHTVSHSSLQSEVKALCEAAKEVSADRLLLENLRCPQTLPTIVYTDSQCAIELIQNRFGYHPKCRHFNRDVNYVRECVDAGIMVLEKIGGDVNPADLTTKLLPADKTAVHTQALLKGVSIHELLRCDKEVK